MDEIQGFFVVQDDEPFFGNIYTCIKIDGFFVTQEDDSGFENGLIVGMMLSNSRII